jgi:hypothetical protein
MDDKARYMRMLSYPQRLLWKMFKAFARQSNLASNGIVLNDAARKELESVWTKVEAIKLKQASKTPGNPLPVQNTYSVDEVTVEDREAAWQTRPECYGENTKAHWDRGVYDNTKHIQSYKNHRISRFKKG